MNSVTESASGLRRRIHIQRATRALRRLTIADVSARYEEILDFSLDIKFLVDFTTVRGEVVDYTIVLLLPTAEGMETIRVYDSAHGFNEMHRYTREGGKQKGTEFHSGTLGEGMRAAIKHVEDAYLQMIEGWRG